MRTGGGQQSGLIPRNQPTGVGGPRTRTAGKGLAAHSEAEGLLGGDDLDSTQACSHRRVSTFLRILDVAERLGKVVK